jgi:CHAT domain-containing protein
MVKSLPLEDFRIIHFATHSLLDEKNANRSALVLKLDDDPAEDGFFQAREIYGVKLNADLIVLSACQTAKGKIEKGEGIQGLARAFFYAGTKSVLASLWKIDDRSTAEFMKLFYEYLVDGKTKQEALRLTKIKMLGTEYSEPYYWASFVLIGESDCPVILQKSSWLDRLFN